MPQMAGLMAASRRRTGGGGGGGGGGGNTGLGQLGPWFDPAKSPWRQMIPITAALSKTGLDWTNYVHADTASMMSGVYIGTDYTSKDIHAWAYDEADVISKGGTALEAHWFGPGGVENVIYGKSTDTFNIIWNDDTGYKHNSILCPIPQNWTGYDNQSAGERRTIITCDDGRAWVAYGLTPPGVPPRNGGAADSNWHASNAYAVSNWNTGITMSWPGGGSGISPGPGLLLPSDVVYARTNGDFGHVLAFNAINASWGLASDPSNYGIPHPGGVWPAMKGYPGAPMSPNGDGKTKGTVGHPHAARIFLDPSLSDTDLASLGLVHKSPDDWTFWLAHTLQRYGAMSKESNTGQGGTGNIMCESVQSIAWNANHGVAGYAGFQWPWIADGTMSGDHDESTFNAAIPKSLMPLDAAHGGPGNTKWKVFDWNKNYPGITVAIP